MPRGRPPLPSPPLALAAVVSLLARVAAAAHSSPPALAQTSSSPLDVETPYPESGAPLSAGALRDPSYLPAQIGGIVAAYGVSLVLVAITLLSLAKRRRERLLAGHNNLALDAPVDLYSPENPPASFISFPDAQTPAHVPNFSYPSPIKTDFKAPNPYIYPSPPSVVTFPGVDPSVDQRVVQADRDTAQRQLADMYTHVMEHEDAKQKGLVLDSPASRASPGPATPRHHTSASTLSNSKDRAKPASLDLGGPRQDKTQSRASSFFSALRSPRKKSLRGVSISSPIMTPQSSTFLGNDFQEMDAMTPRPYAPSPPRPSAADQQPASRGPRTTSRGVAPLTPDISPQSAQSIDERISQQLSPLGGYRPPTEVYPESVAPKPAQLPLAGLPSSPRSGAKSPPLPSSPRPGSSFRRPSASSAVRAGGSLPLRAYEPAMDSPSAIARTTKQTVFERTGPLSPTGRTPRTAGTVPYSPYQPHTPCIPVTPSLVTKEDRKRMKRMVPKTPTLEMVKGDDDLW